MMQYRDQPSFIPSDPDLASPFAAAVALQDGKTLNMVRAAIEKGNVVLAFQPVVQTRMPSRAAFYEGLVRILDPSGRVIPARDFIGAIETSETGRLIDCLALEMGLIALRQEPELRLSINMSARSIGYPRWRQTLRRGLAASPAIGERLILEITESSAMLMPDIVGVFMQELHRQGICFALDDFGAGYTAFRHLREFYFDIIKIDGEFIRGISQAPDNQVLTQALVSIARHFDMFTVAESVESAADASYLSGIGIDCMQGFYFGAPSTQPPWRVPGARREG